MAIEIGYELEVVAQCSEKELKEVIQKHFPSAKFRHARGTRKIPRKKLWDIVDDFSIHTTSFMPERYEIITPAWSERVAVKNLIKLCTMFDTEQIADCNSSTGLHVNVGFSTKRDTLRIDPAKICAHFDYIKWMKYWKRSNNEYCRCKPVKKGTIRSLDRKKNVKTLEKLDAVKKRISHTYDKYSSINFSPLWEQNGLYTPGINRPNGWVEFRVAGGKTYIDDHKGLTKMINEIIRTMYLSIQDGNEKASWNRLKKFAA